MRIVVIEENLSYRNEGGYFSPSVAVASTGYPCRAYQSFMTPELVRKSLFHNSSLLRILFPLDSEWPPISSSHQHLITVEVPYP